MAKIYLINVGANTSHSSKVRSPIFLDDLSWIYLAFPRINKNEDGQAYPSSTQPYQRVANGIKCHLDPDWDGLTYGDSCYEPRSKSLLRVKENDVLLFWGLLWGIQRGGYVFGSKDKRWYLLGAMRVDRFYEAGTKLDSIPTDIRRRVEQNAHVRDGRVGSRTGEVVFVADQDPRRSRRFTRAIDLGVGDDRSLMHRIVKTSDGRNVSWNGKPRWYSVTRACRAILDVEKKADFETATLLARHIKNENEGFQLI
jgi:Nucleotide modification associated domain 3